LKAQVLKAQVSNRGRPPTITGIVAKARGAFSPALRFLLALLPR
jgi:hypothetical protein